MSEMDSSEEADESVPSVLLEREDIVVWVEDSLAVCGRLPVPPVGGGLPDGGRLLRSVTDSVAGGRGGNCLMESLLTPEGLIVGGLGASAAVVVVCLCEATMVLRYCQSIERTAVGQG